MNAEKPGPNKVLSGIRVLDSGRFIAAPLCGAILADKGADVIRIQKREGGDGSTFLQCNRNKRSLTLDTTTQRGQELTREPVRRADVVLANMPDAAMAANQLDYASHKAVKPDIIFGRATAFGSGEHNAEILGEPGIGPDDIAILAADGII